MTVAERTAATLMSTPLSHGETLRSGRYEIKRYLRGGPDKQVYLAYDRELDRMVALDVFAENSVMPNGFSVSVWEARVLGRLGAHPNIGTVLNRWDADGAAFMTSLYLRGGSLRDLIADHRKRGPTLPADDILSIATEIAGGLAHIHDCRILYRDLQPHNVIFDEDKTLRLVDFDTACPLDEPIGGDFSGRPVVAYMAPEEMEGGPVDERADLYSLGATIYEMCSGRPPYVGDSAEILEARSLGGPSRLEREDVPEDLRQLAIDLLAAEPGQRPNAADVVRRLQHIHSARAELQTLLKSDESATLEFKSSLRVPVDREPPVGVRDEDREGYEKSLEKKLEQSVTKTIAAFLNTDGGTLVIGAEEGGSVIGIEVDYPRADEPSRDGWLLTFENVICRDLRTDVLSFIDVQLEPLEGGTAAVVRCTPREKPTTLGKQELFFIRGTAATHHLPLREALPWWHERAGKQHDLIGPLA
jgi:serine/threonine protein kinase